MLYSFVTSAHEGKEASRKTNEWEFWEVAGPESKRRGETGRDGAGRWQEGAGPEPAGGPGPEAPALACPPGPQRRERRMISRYTRKAVPQSVEL